MNANVLKGMRGVVGVVGGIIALLLGGIDQILTVLLYAMAIDYITGLLSAGFNKTLSSKVGFRGIGKKIALLSIVVLAYGVETVVGFPLREITIMFFIANEGLSILENAALMGVPLPEKLKSALIQLKGKGDDDAEVDPAD